MVVPFYLVSPIVGLVLNKGYDLMEKEFLTFYNAREDVNKLNQTFMAIQAVLLDAENKQVAEEGLRDWLEKLKDAAYDANDLLDSWATQIQMWERLSKVHKTFLPLTKTGFYYNIGGNIKKLNARLYKIAQDRLRFHLREVGYNANNDNDDLPEPIGPFVCEEDVVGRKGEVEEIVNLLVQSDGSINGSEVCYVVLIGMPGVGKTTVAQVAFNDKRVKSNFGTRMWVCVSDSYRLSLVEIKRQMIESHTGVKEDCDSTILLDNKLSEILSGNKYLLVLDNVWTYDYLKWRPLLVMLSLGAPGSKVLITTRNKKVWEVLGTKAIVLPCLRKEDSWLMFKRIAFGRREPPKGYLDYHGARTVSSCGGLPMAVMQMAGLLRGTKDVIEWNRIRTSGLRELGGPVLRSLRLSFNYLPSELKQCFAYCSIFPKSYEYRKEEIIKLWIGEAFITPSSKYNEKPEEIGKRYFDQLLKRFFFQYSSANRYRMHDLVHDLALSVSGPYCCQVKKVDSDHIKESSRHVSLHCKDVENVVLSIMSKSKKIRTFLMPVPGRKTFGKSLDKMLKTFKYMRVLDLSYSTILALPKSIKGMKLLRFLDLSYTEIRKLSNSVCKLHNLQTLKLLGCPWIFCLPNNLGNLINLRYLELDDIFWHKTSKLPPRLGTIKNLHNMHSFRIDCQKGYRVEELKDMPYLSGTLHILNLENALSNAGEASLKDKKSLERVVLEWSDRDADPQEQKADEEALEDLRPHSRVKELQITHYRGKQLPIWLSKNNLFSNLVTIALDHCTKCKTITLGNNLEKLKLKGMLELEEWQEGMKMEYTSLIELKISNCPALNKMPGHFLKLQKMKIKKAASLKSLPVTSSLSSLVLIDNLVLDNWNELNSNHSYLNLLELKITNCPGMHELPRVFDPQKLEISGCKLVKGFTIPDYSKHLQHLGLDSCEGKMLLSSIPNSNTMRSLLISNISTSVTLTKWPALPGLRALYIRDCADLVSLSEQNDKSWNGLTSLEMLSIRGCLKLVELRGLPSSIKCLNIRSCPSLESFGSAEILRSLTSLTDLCLEDCPALRSLPKYGLPDSVVHLQIKGCPLLLKRCWINGGGGPDWPKIKDIPDKDIEIESPAVVSSSSSLTSSAASTSTTWYQQVRSCKDIREVELPLLSRTITSDSMRRDRGRDGKGKMVTGPPTKE